MIFRDGFHMSQESNTNSLRRVALVNEVHLKGKPCLARLSSQRLEGIRIGLNQFLVETWEWNHDIVTLIDILKMI